MNIRPRKAMTVEPSRRHAHWVLQPIRSLLSHTQAGSCCYLLPCYFEITRTLVGSYRHHPRSAKLEKAGEHERRGTQTGAVGIIFGTLKSSNQSRSYSIRPGSTRLLQEALSRKILECCHYFCIDHVVPDCPWTCWRMDGRSKSPSLFYGASLIAAQPSRALFDA